VKANRQDAKIAKRVSKCWLFILYCGFLPIFFLAILASWRLIRINLPSREEILSASPVRKVTHFTAQKYAASGRLEHLIAISTPIVAGDPVGTDIAIHLSDFGE
jgi:hypothetical protein